MSDENTFNPDLVPPLVPGSFVHALENASIYYFRYFPKEKTVIIPEVTRRLWGTELSHAKLRYGMAELYVAEQYQEDFIDLFESIEDGVDVATATFCLIDGKSWYRVTMTTTSRDTQGNALEAVAVIEDITEIKAAELEFTARNQSLSFMMQVFEKAAVATGSIIFIYDYINGTAVMPEVIANSWGMSASQNDVLEGLGNSGFVKGESRDVFLDVHEQIKNGAEVASGKLFVERENGESGYYELVFNALYDHEGSPTGKAVGVYHDITQVQEQFLHQAIVTRALAEGISSAFYIDLDDNTFTLENTSSYTIEAVREFLEDESSNGSFDEKITTYVNRFVCDDDRERMLRETRIVTMRARLDEINSYHVQYRIRNDDRDKGYYEMHVVRASDPNGGNKAFLSFRPIDDQMAQEIKQRRILEDAFEAAKQASHAKSAFLSRMSHDIRTPMNAIIGMTAIAGAHIDNQDRIKDCLAKISVSSRHLLGLINEVLDMSKIESGKLDLNIGEFDLTNLLDSLLDMSRQEIKARNQKLSVDVQGIMHEKVAGDAQRIQQVFTNLMSNAIKYTPEGGSIRLTISEKPTNKQQTGCYEFIFEDSGIGMSQEFVDQIFEPFSRASDVRAQEQQGTGLGMAIANNIVQMMNGNIKVQSEPGAGTKITVTIFLELLDSGLLGEDELFSNLPILVVDDDIVTCETASGILRGLGMDCEWVLSGQEALERIKARHEAGSHFFAVIIDWKMPEMDGLETTRMIRETLCDEVPIVIISAYDWTEIEHAARSAGANGFISKPLFRSRIVHLFKTLVHGNQDEDAQSQFVNTLEALKHQHFPGKRALLVEDNLLNAEIASEVLKMAELEVDFASNGQEALDIMKSCDDWQYDIIFMDIQMPIMNGYESARAIRGLDREYAHEVPIIAMTADAFADDVKAASEAGMNEHIAKPIDFDILLDTLNRWLGD